MITEYIKLDYLNQLLSTTDKINAKVALVRVDFNLPLNNNKTPSSISRIVSTIPTINLLLKKGYKIVLMSHFGQPIINFNEIDYKDLFCVNGKIIFDVIKKNQAYIKAVNEYSILNIMKYVEDVYNNQEIYNNCVIKIELLPYNLQDARKIIYSSQNLNNRSQTIYLLENTRLYPGEIDNNGEIADYFASLCDIYVNDAFSVSHRKHASVDAIINSMHNQGKKTFYGLAFENEILMLKKTVNRFISGKNQSIKANNDFNIDDNVKEFINRKNKIAIIGGKKISSKLPLIEALSRNFTQIVLGGAIANTFLAALGYNIGSSYYEKDMMQIATKIIRQSIADIILPSDVITKDGVELSIDNIQSASIICDIGQNSIQNIKNLINEATFVLWCGPIGLYENPLFANGTLEIAYQIAKNTLSSDLVSVAGGGDTIAAIGANSKDFTYCSDAGGALMQYISYLADSIA